MTNKFTWFALSVVALCVLVGCAVLLFGMEATADAQGTGVTGAVWVFAVAAVALLASLLAFVRGTRLLAEERNPDAE